MASSRRHAAQFIPAPSATIYTDADTETFAFTPSAVQVFAGVETGTLSFALTPSGVEEIPTEYTDAATTRVTFTPSFTEETIFAEAPQIYLTFTVTTVYESLGVTYDFEELYFLLTPSGTDELGTIFPYLDVGTEYLHLTPVAVAEGIVHTESVTTEYLHLTPSADEHLCPDKVEFIGDLDSRWDGREWNRWQARDSGRWEAHFLGVGDGYAC